MYAYGAYHGICRFFADKTLTLVSVNLSFNFFCQIHLPPLCIGFWYFAQLYKLVSMIPDCKNSKITMERVGECENLDHYTDCCGWEGEMKIDED